MDITFLHYQLAPAAGSLPMQSDTSSRVGFVALIIQHSFTKTVFLIGVFTTLNLEPI
jgi:hypothetical protein